jgi:hypothetical protein
MVFVASSNDGDTRTAVGAVSGQLRERAAAGAPTNGAPTLVLAFHSVAHDPEEVARRFHEGMPGATTLGCTSSGEIGDRGMLRGGIAAIGLAPISFAVERVERVSSFLFEHGAGIVGRLAAGLGRSPAELDPRRDLFITLIDGMSGNEARLATAVSLAAPGLPIVGGCAGDDERYRETWTFLRGEAMRSSALVLAIEPAVPFIPFAVHHYEPTSERVVVTAADPETNRIAEIDGRPAVEVYAQLAGVPMSDVRSDPRILVGRPVQFGVRVGREFFVHSVMASEGDELIMAVPVVRGLVLSVARATDILEATRAGVRRVKDLVPGGAHAALLFNCAGRMFEARRREIVGDLWEAMSDGVPVAGFSTYGEQFGPMLVNHTLTGVVFGGGEVARG